MTSTLCITKLAVPRGHPPPIHLSADFQNRVEVYEIVDSYSPGYVHFIYELSKSNVDGKYAAKYTQQPTVYLNHNFYMKKVQKFTVQRGKMMSKSHPVSQIHI